jgi:predicted glycogen debranching enzyme
MQPEILQLMADPRARLCVPRERCQDLEQALGLEWLETDGAGGYACGTVLACPTRRYHGLLVAAPAGRARRHVFLAGFDESCSGAAGAAALSTVRYRDTYAPRGYEALECFELAPHPRWSFRVGEARLVRELLLAHGAPVALLRYTLSAASAPLELCLRPLLACREADRLTIENQELDARVHADGVRWRMQPYSSLPPLWISASCAGGDARFEADAVWYRGIEYAADLARGYDGHEDQFSPGRLFLRLEPGTSCTLAVSLEQPESAPAQRFEAELEARLARARPRTRASAEPSARALLEQVADAYLQRVPKPSGGTRLGVVAGYPWFGEWGRDTFIALPGLLLARGELAACGEALEGALEYLQDGLLPNIFGPTRAESDYGSVDAALWFARAVHLHERAGAGAAQTRARFGPALLEIARRYRDGTQLGIACDEQGLLRAGSAALNSTWMDARIGSTPVTPRAGCAIEINALWYHLLAQLEALLEPGPQRAEFASLRARAARAFLERFWLEDAHSLADVWTEAGADRAVRPNMVIAASLEYSPLSRTQRADVVRRAQAELLTPCGLRTLAPSHVSYRGRYQGGPEERDRAYHQGTVWPWLLGAYCEAHLRAFSPRASHLAELRALLDGFAAQLATRGLGHVAEVYDGDPPHRPGGAIAQAWSVAELLRAYALLEEAAT